MSVIFANGRLALFAVLATLILGLSAGSAAAQTYAFSYTGAKVNWSPPVSGHYRVTAIGANGGSGGTDGGLGAQISADFMLSAGTTYAIAVARAGDADGRAGGGGGGTFFVETGTIDTPLLVAGGGAGGGGWGKGGSAGSSYVTGGPGLGGAAPGPASGGGGFYGDGADGSGPNSGGRGWANGLARGAGGPGSGTVAGGFGGGGSGSGDGLTDDRYCGGGGGGYSGGDGGLARSGGTPGSSFSAGSDTTVAVMTTRGNGSLTIVFIPDTSDAAEASIAGFLATRNQLLLSSGPDIQQFIDRFSDGSAPGTLSLMGYSAGTGLPIDVQLGPDAAHFRYTSAYQDTGAGSALEEGQLLGYSPALGAVEAVAPSEPIRKLAFWAEGDFARTSDDALFGVVHVGGDYLLTDSVLLGISAEIDRMTQDSGTALSGTGYSVGPYVTVKLSDNLFFDARVAGGHSMKSPRAMPQPTASPARAGSVPPRSPASSTWAWCASPRPPKSP